MALYLSKLIPTSKKWATRYVGATHRSDITIKQATENHCRKEISSRDACSILNACCYETAIVHFKVYTGAHFRGLLRRVRVNPMTS